MSTLRTFALPGLWGWVAAALARRSCRVDDPTYVLASWATLGRPSGTQQIGERCPACDCQSATPRCVGPRHAPLAAAPVLG